MTFEEKAELERMHDTAKERRHADRIKAIFLASEGWQPIDIPQALRLTEETAHKHIRAYLRNEKLTYASKGTEPRVNKTQETELIQHLEAHLYLKMADIRPPVKAVDGVSYSHPGMHNWLPYKQCKRDTPETKPIVFADGLHPIQSTKMRSGWIRRGKEHTIPTTGSKNPAEQHRRLDCRHEGPCDGGTRDDQRRFDDSVSGEFPDPLGMNLSSDGKIWYFGRFFEKGNIA